MDEYKVDSEYKVYELGPEADDFINDKGNRVQRRGDFEKDCFVSSSFCRHDCALKVGCVFLMVIWSDFRIGQNRDDDHKEDTPHFIGSAGSIQDDPRYVFLFKCPKT